MNRKGFTLIELLIVVTILAILAGAAIPYLQDYVEDSRIARAKTDLTEIKNALALYELKRDEVYTFDSGSTLVNRGFLTNLPIDPWGAPYYIAYGSGTVLTRGPDGSLGGGDDILSVYQPPLAMTAAYWVDANQNSLVDTVAPADYIVVKFTRPLKSSGATAVNGGIITGCGIGGADAGVTVTNAGAVTAREDPNEPYGKQCKFDFTTPFIPGKDTITPKPAIVDGAGVSIQIDTLKVRAR